MLHSHLLEIHVSFPGNISNNYNSQVCKCFNCLNKLMKTALRVNVRIIQSGEEQGSVDLADFHIFCSVFHADSRDAIRFSKIDYGSLKF